MENIIILFNGKLYLYFVVLLHRNCSSMVSYIMAAVATDPQYILRHRSRYAQSKDGATADMSIPY